MAIPNIEKENHEFYDELISRAALEVDKATAVGGNSLVRAENAYLLVSALLVDHYTDPEESDEFILYLQENYNRATGKPLPITRPSGIEWNKRIAQAAGSIRFLTRGNSWNPAPDELAVAILDRDPRLELSPLADAS